MTLACFKCERPLESAVPGEVNQPYAGTVFISRGQYGSTVWDPFDDRWLELNICDVCLREAANQLILQGTPDRTPRRPTYKPWEVDEL